MNIKRIILITGIVVALILTLDIISVGMYDYRKNTLSKKEFLQKSDQTRELAAIKRPEQLFSNIEKITKAAKPDFSVKSTSKGQFSINLTTYSHEPVTVKIYDIIGNLLLQESFTNNAFPREYKFHGRKNKCYVVMVTYANHTKTKKIIA
ncbi:hypothetical protein QQ008_18550 [Fulvivirgaceae bacterium BMA10]|uniref:T9SS type A sorting domain-containing protein n=1 Tax=Splendidivirga corallicola TaxID=3051826 RepID=A0ABT8KRL8_9BACT|nr:hypothetical protein [Fulvivirgaceae bacterium BMA10]